MLILILFVRASVTDIRNRKIEKGVTVVLALFSIIYHQDPIDSLIGALVIAGMVELVNYFISGLGGIGGGDIRLWFASGLLLGIDAGLYALLISLVLALLYSAFSNVAVRFLPGKISGGTDRVPLGPFIGTASVVMMLLSEL